MLPFLSAVNWFVYSETVKSNGSPFISVNPLPWSWTAHSRTVQVTEGDRNAPPAPSEIQVVPELVRFSLYSVSHVRSEIELAPISTKAAHCKSADVRRKRCEY